MSKKISPSLKEFEAFQSEKEKPLIKVILIGDLLFLFCSLIVEFLSQEIFKIYIMSWDKFWILFGGHLLLVFIPIYISWATGYKIGFIKYIFGVFGQALVALWIYFSPPQYTTPLFSGFFVLSAASGILFSDIKVFIISIMTGLIFSALLLLHQLKIGFPPIFQEVAVNILILLMYLTLFPFAILRIRGFLIELLQKRRELEEERGSLQIKVLARTKELEELTQTLDQRVKGRTQELEKSKEELQGRVNELEKFHKLTIGRELKMVELKEEIEKLKEGLEKQKVDNKF